jgi:hypothetical protein
VHIYGLTEPDQPWTIRYVGRVWQPPGRSTEEALQKRLKEHISLAKATQGSANHRVNWIKRVLRQGQMPGIVLLDTGTVATGDDLETFHIKAHCAAGCDLTNNGDGGGANRGKKFGLAWNKGRTLSPEEKKKVHKIVFSPEVRAKISAAKKGKKQDPNVVAKRVATTRITAPERGARIAAANQVNKRTPEQIGRIKEGRRAAGGWVHTPESRAKIGEAGKGRTPWNKGQTGVSDETRAKMRATHTRSHKQDSCSLRPHRGSRPALHASRSPGTSHIQTRDSVQPDDASPSRRRRPGHPSCRSGGADRAA